MPKEEEERYGKAMNLLKEINQEEVDKNVVEWSKFQVAVEKYVGEGNRLSQASHGAMEVFRKLNGALSLARMLKFDITNLLDANVPTYSGEDDPFG